MHALHAFAAVLVLVAVAAAEERAIAARLLQGTVKIDCLDDSVGTGTVVKSGDKILVLTAGHTVLRERRLLRSVKLIAEVPGREPQEVEGRVLRAGFEWDEELDLGIIQPEEKLDGIVPFEISATDSLPVGTRVYHVGAQYGSLSFTTGHVSRNRVENHGHHGTQFTAMALPGSSGGPVVTKDGTVVSIITRAVPGQFCWGITGKAAAKFLNK